MKLPIPEEWNNDPYQTSCKGKIHKKMLKLCHIVHCLHGVNFIFLVEQQYLLKVRKFIFTYK